MHDIKPYIDKAYEEFKANGGYNLLPDDIDRIKELADSIFNEFYGSFFPWIIGRAFLQWTEDYAEYYLELINNMSETQRKEFFDLAESLAQQNKSTQDVIQELEKRYKDSK